MGRLDGKVALIRGGARRHGAAETRLLAKEGASVVLGVIELVPPKTVVCSGTEFDRGQFEMKSLPIKKCMLLGIGKRT